MAAVKSPAEDLRAKRDFGRNRACRVFHSGKPCSPSTLGALGFPLWETRAVGYLLLRLQIPYGFQVPGSMYWRIINRSGTLRYIQEKGRKMAVSDDKVRVQIAFPRALLEKMDAYCKESGLSRTSYVSLLVSKDLENTDKFVVEFKKQLEGIIEKMSIEE